MNVADKLAKIEERIRAAAKRGGREPGQVRLIAVSKRQSVEMIRAAVRAGHHLFGENYFQEAKGKLAVLPKEEFHFIGHLQSNKAREACGLFSLIHTVDRPKVARRIGARAVELGIVQEVLVQVNVGREKQKSGVMPEGLEELLAEIDSMDGIAVKGLMTMPPATSDPEETRPFFAALRKLGERCHGAGLIDAERIDLSMGMSNDFEVAVEEGATLVRVGTAIFGERA